jgi:cytochrome c peroxidase
MQNFFTCALCGTVVFFSIAWYNSPSQTGQQRQRQLTEFLRQQCLDVQKTARQYAATATNATATSDVEQLRAAHNAAKAAYKRIEMFCEYLDPEFTTRYVNGAPLPWIDKKSNFTDIQQPEGFQILDELVFAPNEDCSAELDVIRDKTRRLVESLERVCGLISRTQVSSRMLLEMIRSSTMRMMAMGITAFDRPVSESLPTDVVTPLQTQLFCVELFASSCTSDEARDILLRLTTRHKLAISLAQSTPLDSLDKLEFIREFLNPIYALTAQLHSQLGIETSKEVSSFPVSVEPLTEHLFANNTLNPYKSTGLASHQVTSELIELGRTLFFDPILSENGQRACASCHQPERAFTDGLPKSRALDYSGFIDRNAPTLVNAVFAKRFFMDLRAQRMDDVVEHVVTNAKEFGSTNLAMLGRLQNNSGYQTLFARAFPSEQRSIELHTVGKAISAYLGTLVAMNSEVDKYIRKEVNAIEPSVRKGFNLFMGRAACATCHFPPTFAGYVPPLFLESESEVLAVPIKADTVHGVLDPDVGRRGGLKVDAAPIYANSFKTPTIRNIALTAPYMHNGAYPTLEDVVRFYDVGGGSGIGINHPYQTLAPDRIDLTSNDFTDLIAFMRALTDTSYSHERPATLPSTGGTKSNRTIGGQY